MKSRDCFRIRLGDWLENLLQIFFSLPFQWIISTVKWHETKKFEYNRLNLKDLKVYKQER